MKYLQLIFCNFCINCQISFGTETNHGTIVSHTELMKFQDVLCNIWTQYEHKSFL